MNFGPTTIEITIAIRPAMRTRTIYAASVRQGGRDAFEAHRAGRLDQHDVARPQSARGRSERPPRASAPSVADAVARARARRRRRHVDAELARASAPISRW